jgi:hypothetical protein
MPVEPGAHLRPVLEQEERPERGERQSEQHRSEPADAVEEAVHERRDHLRRRVLRGGGGAGRARGVDAGARQPALDPVDTGGGLRRDLRALPGDAGDDDHEDEDGDGRNREQHERRREHARHAPVEEPDNGHRDHRDDQRADHRPGDRVRLRE